MNESKPQSGVEQSSSRSQPHVVRDILIVAAPIVVLGVVGNLIGLSTLVGGAIINLGYVLAIALGALVLKRQGSSWREIALKRPESWLTSVLLGVAAGIGAVLVFLIVQGVAAGLITALGLAPSGVDQSRFNPIEGNVSFFALMVVLAWTTIAFGEELFYRAFLITRLVDYTRMGKAAAIVIGGAVFGLVHFAEGPVGILSNGAFGLLFGWIYLRSGRNLWITIIGHGLINTLRFALLFAGAV